MTIPSVPSACQSNSPDASTAACDGPTSILGAPSPAADSAMIGRWSLLSSESRSGLHTKAMVVDREHTVIGSYNLDPRSADINSECALLVDSPEFGQRVGEYLDEGVLPENSYHVTLENGRLVWTAVEDGKTVKYDKEPHTTGWQRFQVGFIGVLPIHSQL